MTLSIWQRLSRWMRPATPKPRKASASVPVQSYARGSSMKRRFIMADAFDPSRQVIPAPGLGRKIEELQRSGRYRTAIVEILKVLDRDRGNQEALFLAANL